MCVCVSLSVFPSLFSSLLSSLFSLPKIRALARKMLALSSLTLSSSSSLARESRMRVLFLSPAPSPFVSLPPSSPLQPFRCSMELIHYVLFPVKPR